MKGSSSTRLPNRKLSFDLKLVPFLFLGKCSCDREGGGKVGGGGVGEGVASRTLTRKELQLGHPWYRPFDKLLAFINACVYVVSPYV
ncbi:unnamed protein product [Ixodes persulcatus]